MQMSVRSCRSTAPCEARKGRLTGDRTVRAALFILLAGVLSATVCWGSVEEKRLHHAVARARARIQHVVIIMQENRSFDSYFGTYPHADGIPMHHGVATVCVPDPRSGGCRVPFHDPNDINYGGPHRAADAIADIAGGKMTGFIAQAETVPFFPVDVMGYHDAREIPNYWAYAREFVLQDHMFEPNASWSLPEHLFMVSGWSAACLRAGDPSSCQNALDDPPLPGPNTHYAWTDLTYLLHGNDVSWAYYLSSGTEPDCEDDAAICPPHTQSAYLPGIWNPLPDFDTVRQDGQLGNIQPTANFLAAARNGTLPAVSWVIPNDAVSEHPTARVSVGQAYVTTLINAVMEGPNWNGSAIFLTWDDWGGFYDHVVPPVPLPPRAAPRPANGRAPRFAPRRARERPTAREPGEGFRLLAPSAPTTDPPADTCRII
jgi:phospholipase C